MSYKSFIDYPQDEFPADVMVYKEGNSAVAVKRRTKEVIARSTDHLSVFKKVLEVVPSGGKVSIVTGKYSFNDRLIINKPVTIDAGFSEFDGGGSSPGIFRIESSGVRIRNAILKNTTSIALSVFGTESSPVTDIVIENIFGENNKDLIYIGYAENVTVSNVVHKNSTDTAVVVEYPARRIHITKVIAIDSIQGVVLSAKGGDIHDIVVKGVIADGCDRAVILDHDGESPYNVYNSIIEGVVVRNPAGVDKTGVYIECGWDVIIRDVTGYGVRDGDELIFIRSVADTRVEIYGVRARNFSRGIVAWPGKDTNSVVIVDGGTLDDNSSSTFIGADIPTNVKIILRNLRILNSDYGIRHDNANVALELYNIYTEGNTNNKILSTTKMRGLRGQVKSENSDVATLPTGSTSVTVSHGLARAPSKVLITPLGQPPGKLWVENITDTSFDIVTDTAPSTDLKIAWYAEV